MNQIKINFNMLCFGVEDWIAIEVVDTKIITPKSSRQREKLLFFRENK